MTTYYKNTDYTFKITFTTINAVPNDSSIKLVFGGSVEVQRMQYFYTESTGLSSYNFETVLWSKPATDTLKIYNLAAMSAGTAITLTFSLFLGTSSTYIPTASIYLYWD